MPSFEVSGAREGSATPEAIAAWYREFGEVATYGSSPLYKELSLGVAGDAELLGLLAELPAPKTQPNLLYAAQRLVAGTPSNFATFRATVLERWDEIVPIMLARRTQTNEPRRCTGIYPLLATLPQPLALIEVGTSAGLCLNIDKYRYDYGYTTAGDQASPLTLTCTVDGDIRPKIGPIEVAWRAGLDLNPLDVGKDDDVEWLEMLIWPEHHERQVRFRQAIEIARADPPRIVAGDLMEQFSALAATAPQDATLVVFHTSVLCYLSEPQREAFTDLALATRGHWISQEDPGVITRATADLSEMPPEAQNVLAFDAKPVAFTAPHGGYIQWLVDPTDSAA